MQIGEEKKEENQYQDLSLPLQVDQSLTHRRSKAQSPSLVRNRNTWHSSTLSRSSSGSIASSRKSAMTLATKISSTATIKALSPLLTIQNIMHVQSISTFNTISSGTALRMERYNWNTVRWKTW